MFNKIKEYSGLVAIVVLVVAAFLAPSASNKLGNATASYQDAALGFRVNGNEVVNSAAVVDGVLGGTTNSSLVLTTSSVLDNNFDCEYDSIVYQNTQASVTTTLPAATSTAATCLLQDGTWENTIFSNIGTNTVAFVTSTGDIFIYATSTNSQVMAGTSTYYVLTASRQNSSTVNYWLNRMGTAH